MVQTVNAKVLFPAKTTAEWEAIKTTVLSKGALGIELAASDKTLIKVGDGVTDWEHLPYAGGGSSSGTVDDSYKNYGYENNTIKLYRTIDKTDTPDEINLPEEQFLDQAKTTLANPFTWSATTYPGSEDPDLDGKPVMVLAVKGDTSTSYSFLDLQAFSNAYTGGSTSTTTTDVSDDGEITVDVKVSTEVGNKLQAHSGGLFVGADTVDTELSETSENAVQNKVITAELAKKIGTDDEVIINVVI